LVCSYYHHKQFNPALSAVAVIDFDIEAVTVPVMCLQCDVPACEKVCPVNAISKQADGRVIYNPDKCMVCKLCVQACPLGAISYSSQVRKLIRCDLCSACAEEPQCAAWCAPKAIVYADPTDDNIRLRAVAEGFKKVLMEEVA